MLTFILNQKIYIMKKKKLNSLVLNKKTIANLHKLNSISGGGKTDAESAIICEVDAGGGGGGGGGAGGSQPTHNWMCNPTQSVCGPTQVTCNC